MWTYKTSVVNKGRLWIMRYIQYITVPLNPGYAHFVNPCIFFSSPAFIIWVNFPYLFRPVDLSLDDFLCINLKKSNTPQHDETPSEWLPLEGALHLFLLLVGLFDLVGNPGQELFKVGQEVRLIPPQLSPKTAHLLWTGEMQKEEAKRAGIKKKKKNIKNKKPQYMKDIMLPKHFGKN